VYKNSSALNQMPKLKVTFASDAKPPNHGPMKLCTKTECEVPIFTGDDDTEKDIVLVMNQTGVTREKAIAALLKNDGDIVNAIMDI
jgi:NACalpha-BTF3-like transcription factor